MCSMTDNQSKLFIIMQTKIGINFEYFLDLCGGLPIKTFVVIDNFQIVMRFWMGRVIVE